MRYLIKVQTWWCVEGVVEVEAKTDREAREKALASDRGHEGKSGSITKNKTTIMVRDGQVLTVECLSCLKQVLAKTAHRHDRGYVGECCWDERLRTTE